MSKNDDVGFGKPPKHTQFRKGVSGNPRGRPKGSKNVATVLASMLREKVVVNENGRRRVMTKLDAAVAQLVNQATSGDLGALRQLMALISSTKNPITDSRETNLTEADAKIMQNVLKRIESFSRENNDEN
jgi:hypothetical protein